MKLLLVLALVGVPVIDSAHAQTQAPAISIPALNAQGEEIEAHIFALDHRGTMGDIPSASDLRLYSIALDTWRSRIELALADDKNTVGDKVNLISQYVDRLSHLATLHIKIKAHRVFEWALLMISEFRKHAREHLESQVLLVA
jgi:hypothetical protein